MTGGRRAAAKETLIVDEAAPHIRLITFNSPASLNAMTRRFVTELRETLQATALDESVRAVILTGAGRGFCSGHDLHEMADEVPTRSMESNYESQEAYASLVCAVHDLPQPVVAAVNGPAVGGGLALALASDVRICSSSARFGTAFAKLGLSGCDVGVSYLLPRIVGPTTAFEMMLSARVIGADEALSRGLVLRVVPDELLIGAAVDMASSIARHSPFAMRMTKQVMWTNLEAGSLRAAVELENRTQMVCVNTAAHSESVGAVIDGLRRRQVRGAER